MGHGWVAHLAERSLITPEDPRLESNHQRFYQAFIFC